MSLPFPIVLDGGFATELERQFGKDLTGKLWSAKCLDEDPDAIKAVHRSYFEAGANVATTCSYQATVEGFLEAGYTLTKAQELMKKSVALAREARDAFKASHPTDSQPRLVALSMGPYGAKLANGAEYTGDYGATTKQDLVRFHKDRLVIFLQEPGIDLILFETIPSSLEAEAIHDLIKTWSPSDTTPSLPPIAVAFSCQSNDRISDGTLLEQCVAFYDNLKSVVGVGVNCTKLHYIPSLVSTLVTKQQHSGKALVLYPDGGGIWDAKERSWIQGSKMSPERFCETVTDIMGGCGTNMMVGGCCGTEVGHIRLLSQNMSS